jgi:hypothetical protein
VIYGLFKRALRRIKNFFATALESPHFKVSKDLKSLEQVPCGPEGDLPDHVRTRGVASSGALGLILQASLAWGEVDPATVQRGFANVGVFPLNKLVWKTWQPRLQFDAEFTAPRMEQRSSTRLAARVTREDIRRLLEETDRGKLSAQEFVDAVLNTIVYHPTTGWSRSMNMVMRMKAHYAARADRPKRRKKDGTFPSARGCKVDSSEAKKVLRKRRRAMEQAAAKESEAVGHYNKILAEEPAAESDALAAQESYKEAQNAYVPLRRRLADASKRERVDTGLVKEEKRAKNKRNLEKEAEKKKKEKLKDLKKDLGKARRAMQRAQREKDKLQDMNGSEMSKVLNKN